MSEEGKEAEAPGRRARFVAAAIIGALSGMAVLLVDYRVPGLRTDFDQVWFAAKAMLQGRDPYALIGPSGEFWYGWKFFYPLSAPALVLPLGMLPLLWARVLFVSVSGALLAYLVTRKGWFRLTLFLSPLSAPPGLDTVVGPADVRALSAVAWMVCCSEAEPWRRVLPRPD